MRSDPLVRLLAAAVLLCFGALPRRATAEPTVPARPPLAATAGAENPAAAEASRQLAVALVEDIRRADWEAVFAKMERRYRSESSLQQLTGNLVAITGYYGQPLSFTYKGKEAGERHYPDGEVKPSEKFWFAMPTTKHPDGVFAFVLVVPDGDQPRAAVVSMLSFPDDARPPMLR